MIEVARGSRRLYAMDSALLCKADGLPLLKKLMSTALKHDVLSHLLAVMSKDRIVGSIL